MSETTRSEIIGEALRAGLDFDELLFAGPGKLEGNSDRPLAVAVHHLSMDPDEETGSVDAPGGHVARVDRWLHYTSMAGFVDVIEYETVTGARVAFDQAEREYNAWDEQP